MKPGIIVFAILTGASVLRAQALFMVDPNVDVLYSVNAASGAATLIGSTLPVSIPVGLAHDGISLFVLDSGAGGGNLGGLYRLDPGTGVPTLVRATGITGWEDLAWDPTSDQFFAVHQNDQLYRISTSGVATLVAQTFPPFQLRSLAVDPNGALWTADFLSGNVGTLTKNTATFTPSSTHVGGFQALSFHPATNALYGANSDGFLYQIDPAGSAFTSIGLSGGVTAILAARGMVWEAPAPPGVPAALANVGSGCPGVAGSPALLSMGGLLPRLGEASFALELQNAAPNAGTLWFVAASAQNGAIFIGQSCYVHLEAMSFLAYVAAGVNPIATLTTSASGHAVLPMAIPNDPGLHGASAGVQVAVVDAGSALGFSTSNALNVVLGY